MITLYDDNTKKKTRYDAFSKLQNVCATSLNITKCLNNIR